jgi:CRP-like cAMP-binding protein
MMKRVASESSSKSSFDPGAFLSKNAIGRTIVDFKKHETVFSQGESAETVFYIQKGRIKLTVISNRGKEATIALLSAADFLGEECISTTQPQRICTATALTASTLLKITKTEIVRVLHDHHAFTDVFLAYLLGRNLDIQESLIDQLFNSSEKRLARALLLLARFNKDGTPETVVPKISQETLAEMIGTTRSRVSFFMNRFRKLGFIEYGGTLKVNSSLLNVLLHD